MPGIKGSPVDTSSPTMLPFSCSSCRATVTSCASYPPFSARTLGVTRSASAKASTPSLARPSTVFLTFSRRCRAAATSKAPAPGTTAPSSIVFFTARSPSRTASLICAMVWSLGPLMRMVQLLGFLVSSTKVYLSSPSTCSYTLPAYPRDSGTSSSSELMAMPPHASTMRSMLRFLARRSPRMPSLASMSRAPGSMPFWLRSTKDLLVPSHTCFFRAITLRTRSSVTSRSADTSFSRWSALE
mmetsp:Transcript_50578/g.161824  ORF Transcript_50578/g.161824 Transcript_50578/m.161824 type:complete len:242 (+) Transcript_50578:193-918(+)